MENEALSIGIGAKIAYQRKKLKLTQKAFGDKIELSRSSVVNLEKGRHNVTIPVLYLICEKCDLNILDILLSIEEYKAIEKGIPVNYDFFDNTTLTYGGVADVIALYNKVTNQSNEKKNREESE